MQGLPALSRFIYYVAILLGLLVAWATFPIWRSVFNRGDIALLLSVVSATWAIALIISGGYVSRRSGQGRDRSGTFITCLAAGLSCFWLFTFYPAVMSHDAISHWGQALNNRYSPWHPPMLAMLMHVSQCCASTPSLFSFIEGVLFWGSTFFLLRQVIEGGRAFVLACVVIALLPPIWLYSNAIVSNTWACSFILLCAAVIVKAKKRGQARLPVAAVLALAIGAMFRHEVVFLSLLLIGLDFAWFSAGKGPLRRIGEALLIVVALWLPGRVVELSPRVMRTGDNPAGPGILNQYVGTMVRARASMSESEFATEQRSIDSEFGEGTLQILLERYDCDSGDYIVWRRGGQPPVLSKDVIRNGFAIRKIGSLAMRHPLAFLGHETCYASHLTQFTALDYESWGMVIRDRNLMLVRANRGNGFESRLPSVAAWYADTMQAMMAHPVLTLFFRHYVWLMLAGLVLAVGILNRRVELVVPALFSVFYPIAYLIAGPSPLWRYLLPSYVCSWIGILALAASLVRPLKTSSRDAS
jgi:hypothetical protein